MNDQIKYKSVKFTSKINNELMFRFKEINKINRDAGFIAFRERKLLWLLKLLTIAGCGLMGIWFILDLLICRDILLELGILRIIVVFVFLLNFLIAQFISKHNSKLHLYIGFYLGALTCSLLSVFTVSHDFVYWFGLLFLLVAWHMLVPFSYRKLTFHGLIFIAIFNIVVILFCYEEVHFEPMLQLNMIFLVVNFLAAIVATSRNESDMNDYNNSNIINKQLADLQVANEQLQGEINKRVISEKQLRESQQFLQSVLDRMPGIIWTTDLDGNFLLSEGNGLQKINAKSGEHVGQNAFELYKNEPQMIAFIKEAIKGEVQGEVVTSWGNTWDVRVAPLHNDAGKKTGIIGIAFDISETLKAKNELLKYKQVLEHAPGVVAIFNKYGIIEYINPYFTKISGFSIDEIIGKNIEQFNLGLFQSERYSEISETIKNGKPWTGVQNHKAKDGTEMWFQAIAAPFYDDNNVLQGYLAIDQDITELTKLGIKLQESEEKYRMLVDEARDGIVITQEGKFKFVNHALCEMLGYTEDELLGKLFFDVIVEEDHEKLAQYHSRRMQGENFSVLYSTSVIHKNGSQLNLELHAKTIDYNGLPAAFIVARDITQRIKSEKELQVAKEELEKVNQQLEQMITEQSKELTKATTQLLELQNKNLQTQFEILKSQVNPHFLFNSLNVLSSLIKFEPDLAEEFTEQLAKVYRYILENKDKDLIPLRTEIDFLHAYVFLLNIRFKDKLEVDISIDDEVMDMYLVPLALQLLLENCIKHNTFSKKSPLRIKIYSDRCCYITISNNIQKRESHFASTGVGLKNIESRYALISDNKPEFVQTESEFIARIPMIETV